MKRKEFMERTGLSRKVSDRLYRDVFCKNYIKGKHKIFTEENVQYVLDRKIDKLKKEYNLKKLEFTDEPCYIDDKGHVWNYKNNFAELRKTTIVHGYEYVTLWVNNEHKTYRLHRLVAEYFVPNSDKTNNTVVNHIDGNKHNNCASNLEWCTTSYNTIDAIKRNGLNKDEIFKTKSLFILDKEQNIIDIFSSIREAENHLNIRHQYLSYLAKTEKFSKKYNIYVKYANE